MRGVYTASHQIAGLNASKTLMYLTAPSDAAIEILSIAVTNADNAVNEQLEILLGRISSLGTPTDSGVTPSPDEVGDQAANATVRANVTASEPTYGAVIAQEGFASLNGWTYPRDPMSVIVPPSGSIGLKLLSTPDAFDCNVTLRFREIG